VTHLRKMMLEELQRRNYAETTIGCYLHAVEDFSRHFHCSPDRLVLYFINTVTYISLALSPLSGLDLFPWREQLCQDLARLSSD